MKKWNCYGQVVGSKYLGQVEAETSEEALEHAAELDSNSVSFCHHCSGECEDPEVREIVIEEDK